MWYHLIYIRVRDAKVNMGFDSPLDVEYIERPKCNINFVFIYTIAKLKKLWAIDKINIWIDKCDNNNCIYKSIYLYQFKYVKIVVLHFW